VPGLFAVSHHRIVPAEEERMRAVSAESTKSTAAASGDTSGRAHAGEMISKYENCSHFLFFRLI
jgi:hypothetical protein